MLATTTKKPERILSENFAEVFRAYMEASDEVQVVIREMVELINDGQTDDDEREAAYATLVEALFPVSHNGSLGIDIGDLREEELKLPEIRDEIDRRDSQERTFANRLQEILEQRGLKQADLAELIGVQQPAISMMLARKCHPQRRTLEKIAAALNINVEELWPSLE